MLKRLSPYANLLRPVLVALVLVALVIYGSLNLDQYFTVEDVTLPDVVGMNKDRAVSVLSEMGLEPLTFTESVASAELNTVSSQTPLAGTVVRAGRSVSIGVNEPQASAPLPNLTGATERQARASLQEAQLELGEVTYRFDGAERGAVLSQSPEPGAALAPGEAVNMVVSRGPDVAKIPMPSLRGLQIEAAKNRLKTLGFTNVDTTATSISFERPQSVTEQLPLPGETVPTSTRVILTYSLSTDMVVQVPYLNGMSLGRAQLLLQSKGLSLGPVSYVSDPAQAGGVLTYEPDSYTLSGAPVSLTLNSSGTPNDNLALGFPAQGGIGPQGPGTPAGVLTPGVPGPSAPLQPPVQRGDAGTGSPARPEVGTTPAQPAQPAVQPSTPSAADSLVGVAAASAAEYRVVPFDFDPAKLGMQSLRDQAYILTLEISDEEGERTAYDQTLSAGEAVYLDVAVYGEAILQTYVNGVLYLAWNP